MNDFYKKLLVIGAILIVVLELTSLGGFGILKAVESTPTPAKNQTQAPTPVAVFGTAYANASVTSLRPYFIVQALGNVTENQVRAVEGVDDVVPSQGAYAIGVNNPERMAEIYARLKGLGLAPQAIASLSIENTAELVSNDGKTTTITLQGTGIELTLKKPLALQTKLRIRIDGVQAVDGKFAGGQSVALDFRPVETHLAGSVTGQETVRTYTYPWQARNTVNMTAIKEQYGSNAQTIRKDYFTVNATALEVSLAAQNKSYILKVQDNKVFVAKDFADVERVTADFGQNVQFEDSTVTLTNQTIEGQIPDKTEYVLNVRLEENEYGLDTARVESLVSKENGEDVQINATVLADGPLGDSVVVATVNE